MLWVSWGRHLVLQNAVTCGAEPQQHGFNGATFRQSAGTATAMCAFKKLCSQQLMQKDTRIGSAAPIEKAFSLHELIGKGTNLELQNDRHCCACLL